jgi:hypothetical protein
MAQFMEIEAVRRKRQQWKDVEIVPRGLSNYEQDMYLHRRFRFTRDGINYISDLISDDLRNDSRGGPTPIDLKVIFENRAIKNKNF